MSGAGGGAEEGGRQVCRAGGKRREGETGKGTGVCGAGGGGGSDRCVWGQVVGDGAAAPHHRYSDPPSRDRGAG